LRRPAVRFSFAVAMTAVVGVSPRWARGPAVLLWLAAVVFAFPPLGRGLREIAAKRIVPRFAYAGQRVAHSMRVARMKAAFETSSSSLTPVASAAALPALEDVDERPRFLDITGRRTPVDTPSGDYPTGAWGEESRQYLVSIRVPAEAIGHEMLAARVGVVVDRHSVEEALVKAIWTDDAQRSTRINREVAHYTGQAHLAEAIQDGLDAHKAGDESTATLKLARAVQLAAESNNHDTMKLLLAVLDIDDAATGSVRLKRNVAQEDEMALDTRSTKTVGVRART
jgi:von Willebrand factor type A C-terminal domain